MMIQHLARHSGHDEEKKEKNITQSALQLTLLFTTPFRPPGCSFGLLAPFLPSTQFCAQTTWYHFTVFPPNCSNLPLLAPPSFIAHTICPRKYVCYPVKCCIVC